MMCAKPSDTFSGQLYFSVHRYKKTPTVVFSRFGCSGQD